MQTTITPKYLNEPKPGKKNWSIKDEAGVYYSVAPDMVASMKVGQPVTFDYKVNNFQGKDFNIVERVYGTNPSQAAPAMLNQPLSSQAGQGHNSNGHKNGGDAKSEDIFVCGVVNHAIASQSLPLDAQSLSNAVRNARKAWRNGEPKNEPNDEMPF